MSKLYALFIITLSTHVISCAWLLVGRVDPNRKNWFMMAGYTEGGPIFSTRLRSPTAIEIYVDTCIFIIASMTGLGWGNIVAKTNLEYFVDMFVFLTGSSIYIGFFG